MTAQQRSRWTSGLESNILLRVALYYAGLAAALAAGWALFPQQMQAMLIAPVREMPTNGVSKREAAELLSQTLPHDALTAVAGVAGTSVVAMVSATLLSIPIAWIYILTRQKKGYRQSVVQTLIVLPIVVGGVVVLVKNSLALAFSLAGIVAAVKFRNTLDDSKDAVYIFLATAVGLASGVQPASAAVLSVMFNMVILALWYTDFGRAPADLEGRQAERRLERAVAVANRTGMFVAKLDDEILKGMSPSQLDALADRAWRRRKRTTEDAKGVPESPELERLLRIQTMQVRELRDAVEPALDEKLLRWRFGGVIHEAGGIEVVEYGATLRDGVSAEELLDELRARGGAHVAGIRLV